MTDKTTDKQIEITPPAETFRGSAVLHPSYESGLDQERAASMADEGGRSGAVMEVQDLRHNERMLHERDADRTMQIGLIALGVGLALIAGSVGIYMMTRTAKPKLQRARKR